MNFNKQKAAKILLGAIYFFGFLGLSIPALRTSVVLLTPFTLLITAIVLFAFHRDWRLSFFFFIAIAYLTGYFVEVVGVASGQIFGHYQYSDVLGPKVLNTPLMIGINWLLLIYASGSTIAALQWSIWGKAALAALLVLLIDVALEPAAIALNFWSWKGNVVPMQNYLSWYIISFLLLFIFYKLPFEKRNPLSFYIYILQILFFVLLALTISPA